MAAKHTISITIADILIELSSKLSASELGIKNKLEPFFGLPKNKTTKIKVRWEESLTPPQPSGELVYDPGSIWKMYRDGTDYQALMTYHAEDQAPQAQALLHANASWSNLSLHEQRKGKRWQSLLNIGAGELIFRTAILFTGGIVFHASGLDDNGRGIVFIGHSEAGKSTQVELWVKEPSVTAMNDDRIAVRGGSGEAQCYGTPWGGTAEIARNHAAPLKALVILEQAPENKIKQISTVEAAPLILARSFLPYWDQILMEKAMFNIDSIMQHVPIYRLRCRPEKEVIALVRSVL